MAMRRDDALIPLYLWASLLLLLHFGFFSGTSAVASRIHRGGGAGVVSAPRTVESEVDFELIRARDAPRGAGDAHGAARAAPRGARARRGAHPA